MLTMILIAAMLIAFAATLLSVPAVRWLAVRQGWIDIPDQGRKVHSRPTPNIGGMAVFAGFAAGLLALLGFLEFPGRTTDLPTLAVLAGAIVMASTGFYDDIWHISFRRKFLVQIAVAYLLLLSGFQIDVAGLPFLPDDPYSLALISAPLTLLWIVGIINAVNLMDGLDGLASGITIIAFGAFALIFAQNGGGVSQAAVAMLMIGALAGFLVYNFTPASIFLGDSGSLFIGYMLAVFSLGGTAHGNPLLALVVLVVVLGLPILDTTLCIMRRLIAGKSPYAPDSDHIHHRLDRLFSQRKAVVILYFAALWFSIAGYLISIVPASTGALIALVTLLAAYVGIRTLGYLDINLFAYYRLRRSRQLTLEFESDTFRPSVQPPILRRNHHNEVAQNDRTLPVRLARHRAQWRRDIGPIEDDELIFLKREETELIAQLNGEPGAFTTAESALQRPGDNGTSITGSDP